MADKKDAAATKAAAATTKAAAATTKAAAKRGKKKPRSKVGKDPVARAWRILKLSLKPKSAKPRSGKKDKRNARKTAFLARFPKIAKKIKLHQKLAEEKKNVRAKVSKLIKDAEPPKVVKGKKRPAPKESKEKVEVPPEKKVKPGSKRSRPHKYKYSGVMKFSKPLKRFSIGKWKVRASKTRKAKPKKPIMVRKEIGGDKNGGFRMVLRKKRRQNYPTADPIRKRRPRGLFKNHKRYTRKSLKPGTVCILLAGPYKGKRVVMLKVLPSGHLLVNGPMCYNGCPLRRMNQNFVIATRTRFELPAKVPAHLDDKYFKKVRPKRVKKGERDIFSVRKEKPAISEQRKVDQKAMDKLVILALREHAKNNNTGTLWLKKYLKSMWGLRRNQFPHSIRF